MVAMGAPVASPTVRRWPWSQPVRARQLERGRNRSVACDPQERIRVRRRVGGDVVVLADRRLMVCLTAMPMDDAFDDELDHIRAAGRWRELRRIEGADRHAG